jgi:alpha-glucosidase
MSSISIRKNNWFPQLSRTVITGARKYLWWEKAVIYEIYPRSFMDSDGDGIGDLQGIISKLDYLKWLGVGAIWIGPFYPSPMADLGYDISDYKGVHPLYGDLDDFDELLRQAHQKNIRVIIDFVPNHSSDQHLWFLESAASKDNPKADWYLWHDGDIDGRPPNNWISVFGGSAWEWNEKRKQYYYHAFLKEQPDLNLRNAEVQNAIFDAMRFWLNRGVDGLRVDVMWHLYKDPMWRDNPPNPAYKKGEPEYDKLLPVYSTDHAEVIDIVRKMRKVMDEFEERVMLGEMYLSIHQTVAYYGPDNSGAQMPGNFTLLLLPWEAHRIAAAIDECESSVPSGAWPNWVLGNHDRPRLATRVGDEQVRVAAMMLLTLRGTPTIYNGDEIGMRNIDIPKEEIQDPQGKKMNLNRDSYRTPMQWNNKENAGFTSGKPWIRIADDYRTMNVEDQRSDPCSTLSLYKKLLELRDAHESLQTGAYIPVPAEGTLLVYRRQVEKEHFLIALNLGHEPQTFTTTRFPLRGVIVLDTQLKKAGKEIRDVLQLDGNEGIIMRVVAISFDVSSG